MARCTKTALSSAEKLHSCPYFPGALGIGRCPNLECPPFGAHDVKNMQVWNSEGVADLRHSRDVLTASAFFADNAKSACSCESNHPWVRPVLSSRQIVCQRKVGGDLLDNSNLTGVSRDTECGSPLGGPRRERICSHMDFLPDFFVSNKPVCGDEPIEQVPQSRKDIDRIDAPAVNE
jgi:hypothetical protein